MDDAVQRLASAGSLIVVERESRSVELVVERDAAPLG
jgi:hypothetical protein